MICRRCRDSTVHAVAYVLQSELKRLHESEEDGSPLMGNNWKSISLEIPLPGLCVKDEDAPKLCVGNIFMRSPNNVLYTSAHALFDEELFPKRAGNNKRMLTKLPDINPDAPSGFDDDEEPPRPPKTLPLKGQGKARAIAPALPQPAACAPSPPPDPPVEEPTPLRCSGRERKVPANPDNVCRDEHPVQIYKKVEKQRT